MTIGAAWIRRTGEGEELWFASDSRLSGDGNLWDSCPKLLTLPRRDSIIGFSGSTFQAYPLMIQIAGAIAGHQPAVDGSMELFHVLGHIERVVNGLMGDIVPDPGLSADTSDGRAPEFSTSGDTIVIGGYSRSLGGLAIRSLGYRKGTNRWEFSRVRGTSIFGVRRTIAVFGDRKGVSRYRYLLRSLLSDAGLLRDGKCFDMEPLQALSKYLAMPSSMEKRLPLDRRPSTIGGAPQLINSLPGGEAKPLAVRWTDQHGHPGTFFQGRPALGYESLQVPLVSLEGTNYRVFAPGHWPVVSEPVRHQ